ncbi:MAG: hypothetical protein ACLR50_06165 [Segatella copri]|jgi:hypothetical protein
MKEFRKLTISSPDVGRLIALLNQMKENDNHVFRFQKKETENYAKNIFLDESCVACFKTERKTLFESKVWLYIGSQGLVVANITSDTNRSLGVINYNRILSEFFTQIVEPRIHGYEYELTNEDVSLAEILPENIYQLLDNWQATCDKSSPIDHPEDQRKWMEFVVAYVSDGECHVTSDEFERWLQEDCGWPIGFAEQANDMAINFEYSVDLLKLDHEHRNIE